MPREFEEFLRVNDFAEALGVTPACVKVGRLVRIPASGRRVAYAEIPISDVVVTVEILWLPDGSYRVVWPDAVEVPLDVRVEIEAEVPHGLVRCGREESDAEES